MKSVQRGFTAIELFVVALILAFAGGWIANVVKLVGMDLGTITGLLVVRAIGIFVPPLGAVMGFV